MNDILFKIEIKKRIMIKWWFMFILEVDEQYTAGSDTDLIRK